jgi:hypothetical protein
MEEEDVPRVESNPDTWAEKASAYLEKVEKEFRTAMEEDEYGESQLLDGGTSVAVSNPKDENDPLAK